MSQAGRNYYQAPAQPSNGLGTAGFIVSLVGLLISGGVLCPIGFVLSFFGLFKRPRGLALAGLVIGLIGSLIPLLIFVFFGAIFVACVSIVSPHIATEKAINDAHALVQMYESTHGNVVPVDADGQTAIDGTKDGWGHPLRYQRTLSGFEIRSAGPDGVMGTGDDEMETFSQIGGITTMPER